MANKILCFYHNADLDGRCSGFIVKKVFPEAQLYGIDYHDDFPWDKITKDLDAVIMVDFSLQPIENMVKLAKMYNLIWIDHHKSAIEEWKKQGIRTAGKREVGVGACLLCWKHFIPRRIEIPLFVKLLAEYDVWDHSDPRTLPFQYGLRLEGDTSPENIALWNSLFDPFKVEEVIKNGELVLQYIKSEYKRYVRKYAFPVFFEGYRALALNRGMVSSMIFDQAYDKNDCEMFITFVFNGFNWTVSLYSNRDDIDVSEIAKKYGGGGHKGSAGFICKNLSFLIGKEI